MKSREVVVIDYGVGNLLSVQRGLESCGANVILTAEPDTILAAEHIVLPGVGAFSAAMETLQRLDLVAVLREAARREKALLCICLGMQLLLDESEEFGVHRGLGIIPGRVVPVPGEATSGDKLKIPHIGWSALEPADPTRGWRGTLLEDNARGDSVYFVHSFMAVPNDPEHRIANCRYGGNAISAAITSGRVSGFQFHPEKSGSVGLKILRKFLES